MSHEPMLRTGKELKKQINALTPRAEILEAQEDKSHLMKSGGSYLHGYNC
jgi:hypothetical protein